MSASGEKRSLVWPVLVVLLSSSAVPSRISADDNGANAPSARTETPKIDAPTSAEQGPADNEARTNSEMLERRALPAPLDWAFPGSDYLGPTPLIGVPDTDPLYPLTKAVSAIAPALKDARIKIYGWANPGISVSSSNKSNIPESYAIVPNRLELDQAVLRIERLPDTVQTDHLDWGFRLTPMYGIDYRWTTSQGWFSGQLLKHNYLYGFDPVEAYPCCTSPTSRVEWSSSLDTIFPRQTSKPSCPPTITCLRIH